MAEALTRKQIIQAVWNKFKAIIGNHDISGIGDGTVTGALAGLNGNSTEYLSSNLILERHGKTKILIFAGCTYADFLSADIPAAELPAVMANSVIRVEAAERGRDFLGVIGISQSKREASYVTTYGGNASTIPNGAYLMGQLIWISAS